jgi:hypothetical protein
LSSSLATITCEVELRGTLHAAIAKVEGALVGRISAGAVANCRASNRAPTRTVLLFPEEWHVRFLSFAGTLPNITSIRFIILLSRFLLDIGGITCLFTASVKTVSAVTGGEVRQMRIEDTTRFSPERGGLNSGFCTAGSLSGEFSLTTQRIRLI